MIHCLLDSFAFLLNQRRYPVDYRPLYFGAWNVPITWDENHELTYFSTDLSPQSFVQDFTETYGEAIDMFLFKSKNFNFDSLHNSMPENINDKRVIACVDLFYLNYPNRCYKIKHRPHLVIIEQETKDCCRIIDSYFNWSGSVPHADIASSFIEATMWFTLDTGKLHSPTKENVLRKLADSCLNFDNELSSVVSRNLSEAIELGGTEKVMKEISKKLSQLGVLAKRKKAYEYAFSYLSETMKLNLDLNEERMKILQTGWSSLAFLIVKLGINGKVEDLVRLLDKVENLANLESEIKADLLLICKKAI
ncbi:DUF6005 family protein [Paenibacillus cucumis (ex Kampfer et al. 2016)]|uniref:Butirosin biosynthesis protein H N-terminal domain-containing protein n=1 Tax=Paenibacillus cucumis (ex Kampfer et al. 2016) TaxID=1776858 RepID=A0ABS7KSP7_9BACL|nr:DUF6005 family protein [Paenibacillus cucumis (ex Kampfer et al. 2016)]MBY0207119.1 hypothetical protein [Paenibacillus cucumis (ex Kampfer et al. 2016)]